jgi:hypothetical protein
MADFTKVDSFVEYLAESEMNLAADSLKVALTNSDPTRLASVLADITEISVGNGYSAGGNAITILSSGQVAGVYTLVLDDWTVTASGAAIGPFQYFVLLDSSIAGSPIIGYWDAGAPITVADGDYSTLDLSASAGAIQIA